MNGTYRVQLTTTNASSPLTITAPDGSLLPNGAVQAAYVSDHINFTLSNAGTMTAGDYFNIVVANGTGKAALFDPTATDGSQVPYGVITHGVDATSADVAVTALVRLGLVKKAVLTFKSTVTAAQKNAAYAAMLSNNVVARD
jgi:hypothetical protein